MENNNPGLKHIRDEAAVGRKLKENRCTGPRKNETTVDPDFSSGPASAAVFAPRVASYTIYVEGAERRERNDLLVNREGAHNMRYTNNFDLIRYHLIHVYKIVGYMPIINGYLPGAYLWAFILKFFCFFAINDGIM